MCHDTTYFNSVKDSWDGRDLKTTFYLLASWDFTHRSSQVQDIGLQHFKL